MIQRFLLFLILGLSQFIYAQSNDLARFFEDDAVLAKKVDSIYGLLTEAEIVGQMMMPAVGRHGRSKEAIVKFIETNKIGGVLLLNGEKHEFQRFVHELDSIGVQSNALPFLYSADAEPSLIRYKIKNTSNVANANELKSSEEVKKTAMVISNDLKEIGINYNFAPVIDQGNENSAITNRSFGYNKDSIWVWSNAFIKTSQGMGIIATAKHFPCHGLVVGDTHKKLVFIDGILKEVENYKPVIDQGVLSIMVGHIAVKNNPKYGTFGMPATCSRKIVNDLLKVELGFRGLVVTDAMNMGGVRDIENAAIKAVEAGCDILLMPVNLEQVVEDIQTKMKQDQVFKERVEDAVKKIIRVKICLGLI